MKIYIRSTKDDNYEMLGDYYGRVHKITNAMVLGIRHDLSSIGLEEDRTLVTISILSSDLIKGKSHENRKV